MAFEVDLAEMAWVWLSIADVVGVLRWREDSVEADVGTDEVDLVWSRAETTLDDSAALSQWLALSLATNVRTA